MEKKKPTLPLWAAIVMIAAFICLLLVTAVGAYKFHQKMNHPQEDATQAVTETVEPGTGTARAVCTDEDIFLL